MGINVPEILVANCAGLIIVAFLLFFRIRKQKQFIQAHEKIFSIMLVLILAAITSETVSFLIDGQKFRGCFFIQHLSNFICLGFMVALGFLWSLFVDYRIYNNTKRLRRKARLLSIPLLIIDLLMIGDLFGNGIIFSITADNCYIRGKLNILIYIVLFLYLMESVANAYHAQKKGITPFFFPIYCFIVPCMVGTICQGCFYGLSVGWLSTSVASMFIYFELQTVDYYMDELSGLFNRRFMNYYITQKSQRNNKFYGIVLDINDFKSINDIHGHTTGDRAIYVMGKILSQSIFQNAIAVRVGGDEFVIFLSDSNEKECVEQMELIQQNIDNFNKSKTESFHLSVAMGSECFDGKSMENFLSKMDFNMYEAKRQYHDSKKM